MMASRSGRESILADPSPAGLEQLSRLWARRVPNGAASDMVYQVLREALITRVIPPGQRLAEEHLARLFDVSRTPVREALFRLEAEGFAERIPRRGLVASQITPREIVDVYVVRESMDGLAAELAAQHATAADLLQLTDINERFTEAATLQDLDQQATLNLQFHEALAQASHNAFLLDMIKQIHHRVRRFPGTTFAQEGRAAEAAEEHRRLIQAIRERDTLRARRLAAEHMAAARRIRIAMLDETPAAP